ncbi:o-succinylbenzoate synthase [Tangfeifania diversioriginum]|uniref:O-succinylbenzoate synthase n=1 Tax=Tangfeifania diversioriginum TaxID=1168035 RepID=A0A1M6JIP1_9BACT|nr:o-succinylbenzoate synthase [Tangfeifania diversioriginum]SHJ46505.1 o-succinylbenzoate synthase [Tangfeifania diversioriginum]
MKARYKKYELHFKRPASTSRGTYKTRTVWFLMLEKNGKTGIGECAPLPGLSTETPDEVESLLNKICANPKNYVNILDAAQNVSSVRFALETALQDLKTGGRQLLFPSGFTEGKKGILINGLIWMGEPEFILSQIQEKLKAGFRCIKLKIGSLDFKKELEILKSIRENYDNTQITLRVDANGAFHPDEAMEKLHKLAQFDLHSIEQPIAAGQWKKMAKICKNSPVPVTLDEELIGIHDKNKKEKLLNTIRPQFIILKPSLHGGLSGCEEWIELAKNRSIGWWVTSYLESDIGLNAIAQWTFQQNAKGHQGLGTGQLFTNNIPSPLEIRGEKLWFNPNKIFEFPKTIL